MYVLLALVGVVLLSVVSSLGYNHYVNEVNPGFMSKDTTTFGVQLEEAVAQVTNPEFTTVNDVFEFYERTSKQKEVDSIFLTIPPKVLVNIAKVVIGREGTATKESIVDEFRQNYDAIYKHLIDNPDSEITLVPDESSTRSVQVGDTLSLPPGVTHDTVINGKKFRLVKETKENG